MLLLVSMLVFPVPLQAAAGGVNSVDITAVLQEDGSASMTEVWDIDISSSWTEYYIAQYNLDGMEISEFTVTDQAGRLYEDVGAWETSRPKDEKAGQSGLIEINNGYELCWGIGDAGEHNVFTLRYKITGLVRGYNGADALHHIFVPEGANAPKDVHIAIEYPKAAFTKENTGVWVFGFSADYGLENGKIEVQSDKAMKATDSANVLAEFEKGMFSPAIVRNRDIGDVRDEAFKGSDYEQAEKKGLSKAQGRAVTLAIIFGMPAAIILLVGINNKRKKRRANPSSKMKREYKDAVYWREIPFGGNLPATYTRLEELGKLPNDGTIIGAYLLRWLRTGVVEIVSSSGAAELKFPIARQGLEPAEQWIYDLLASATGPDDILRAGQFKKWSKENYSEVRSCLWRLKNEGEQQLRNMGARQGAADQSRYAQYLKGMVMTPLGEDLTVKMFGFKKYLEEFSIINQREVKEIHLWDQYLVFAQLMGIAKTVAKQFKEVYPDYFRNPEYGAGAYWSMRDIDTLIDLSASVGYAMSAGYHAGQNAANRAEAMLSHDSRDSGGGGHSSSGGGGGATGGGGHGGR